MLELIPHYQTSEVSHEDPQVVKTPKKTSEVSREILEKVLSLNLEKGNQEDTTNEI